MKEEQVFIESIQAAVSSSEDIEQCAEAVSKIKVPKTDSFSINEQVLADYVEGFQLDWDEQDFEDDGELATESVNKIKQILGDIKLGNKYSKVFSSEIAYSHLEGEDYLYKVITAPMQAKTDEEAVKQLPEIRAKAPKTYPAYSDYKLEDVRIRVRIVDQKGAIVIKEQFFTNEIS